MTFQFRFTTVDNGLTVKAGTKTIPVPLINLGPVAGRHRRVQNVVETYTVTLVRGDRRTGTGAGRDRCIDGQRDICQAARQHRREIHAGLRRLRGEFHPAGHHSRMLDPRPRLRRTAPGRLRGQPGRDLRPGQHQISGHAARARPAPTDAISHPIRWPATTSPRLRSRCRPACLTAGGDPVIGGWTTASLRQASVLNPQPQSAKSAASVGAVNSPTGAAIEGGAWSQVSRLGMPLVNELVIGLPDKDRFNASSPSGDAQFADYVTNPSLPVLLQTLFGSAGVVAPNVYPRTDLEAAFLTGIKGLNQPPKRVPSEETRLNTSTPVTPIASQNDLGVLGGDLSGFPNGRRPIDDVVDIELRVAMGVLLHAVRRRQHRSRSGVRRVAAAGLHGRSGALSGQLPAAFPYLNTALAGSPTSAND